MILFTDETADSLYRGVLAEPDNDLQRLVLADRLEEIGQTVPCPECKGTGSPPIPPMPPPTIHEEADPKTGRVRRVAKLPPFKPEYKLPKCSRCEGRGGLPDGLTEWAEFIRLQIAIERGQEAEGDRTREAVLFTQYGDKWFPEFTTTINPAWYADPNAYGDGPEVRGLVRRGFLAEMTGPLGGLRGGECVRCESRGTVMQEGSLPIEWYDTCPDCKGAGRTPGHLRELVRRWPIQRVVVTDREPHQRPNGFWLWFGASVPHPPAELPRELFRFPRLMDVYPTREAAVAALSDALLQEAREESP